MGFRNSAQHRWHQCPFIITIYSCIHKSQQYKMAADLKSLESQFRFVCPHFCSINSDCALRYWMFVLASIFVLNNFSPASPACLCIGYKIQIWNFGFCGKRNVVSPGDLATRASPGRRADTWMKISSENRASPLACLLINTHLEQFIDCDKQYPHFRF